MALSDFCLVNSIEPDQMLNIIHTEEEKRVPDWDRSINMWFENYEEHCKSKNRTKSTLDLRRTIVNAFISFHGLPMFRRKGGRRKIEGLKEPNKREILTKDDINDLLLACKSFKMRAMILVQVSSGLSSVDMLNLKVGDFQDGIMEVYDEVTRTNRMICQLNLKRQKTSIEFTTFLSEEAVEAVNKYLKFECDNPQPENALFTSYNRGGKKQSDVAVQDSYRKLNRYLKWEQETGKFRKATSHMMRKFFNTQLIHAGMPEEIREHFMGHKYSDPVRRAYYLPDPKNLKKVYIKYMEHVTITEKLPITMEQFRELKNENSRLCDMVSDLQKELMELKSEV
jgi:integrase